MDPGAQSHGWILEHRATGLALREELPDPITSCMKHREPTLDLPASANPCAQDSEQVLGAKVLLFQRTHLYSST